MAALATLPLSSSMLPSKFAPISNLRLPCDSVLLTRWPEETSLKGAPSLPLNRPRRLARHVIHHPVDALDLVDDPRRGLAEEFHLERIKVRRHAVGRSHRTQADDIFVGAPVAHHA